MRRVAWWTLLAALAVIATFAQLDRASYLRPELAAAVPKPFRSFAQVPVTGMALRAEDRDAAHRGAERLVRLRPLPAEHLLLLALADLGRGDTTGYARAFELATARGWRSRPLQHAAARAALARGDAGAAANRIAALWALDASDPMLPEPTRELLATQPGQSAFAAKLAGTKVWQNLFLQRALEFATPASALETVRLAAEQGARFECAQTVAFERAIAASPARLRPVPIACMTRKDD